MTTNYGIQYQPLSKTIATGRLNKTRTLFLDKQDVTGSAVGAVVEYVHHAFDGAMLTEDSTGQTWHVQVTEMEGDDE